MNKKILEDHAFAEAWAVIDLISGYLPKGELKATHERIYESLLGAMASYRLALDEKRNLREQRKGGNDEPSDT